MGMPVASRPGIISRTDPRITGGVSKLPAPVAPPPTDPLPRNTTQPVGPRQPATMPRGAALAGPGGVPGGRGLPGRAGRGGVAGIGTPGFTKRQASTPPWLRAQPAGAVIGS